MEKSGSIPQHLQTLFGQGIKQPSQVADSTTSKVSKVADSPTSKVSTFAGSLLGATKKVTSGADKVVHVHVGKLTASDPKANKAYYTPNRAFGFSRKKQLKAEVKIYKTIQRKLQNIDKNPDKSKLAIGHKELSGKERIKSQYTVEVQRAEGAADNVINYEMSGTDVMKMRVQAWLNCTQLVWSPVIPSWTTP